MTGEGWTRGNDGGFNPRSGKKNKQKFTNNIVPTFFY